MRSQHQHTDKMMLRPWADSGKIWEVKGLGSLIKALAAFYSRASGAIQNHLILDVKSGIKRCKYTLSVIFSIT